MLHTVFFLTVHVTVSVTEITPATKRYDTTQDACYLNVRSKADRWQTGLVHRMEPKTKKWRNELKSKNGCAQKYR